MPHTLAARAPLIIFAVAWAGMLSNATAEDLRASSLQKRFGKLYAETETTRAQLEAQVELLKAATKQKIPGLDVFRAKREIYLLAHRVPRLYLDSPDLTKADLQAYLDTAVDCRARIARRLKDIKLEGAEFRSVSRNEQSGAYVFVVNDGKDLWAMSLRPSQFGIFGAKLDRVFPDAASSLGEVRVKLLSQDPSDPRSSIKVLDLSCRLVKDELTITHKLKGEKEFEVVAVARPKGRGFGINFQSPVPVTDMSAPSARRVGSGLEFLLLDRK